MSSNSVGVELQGREYQIRSDADAESLQRVAGYVDKAMNQIREVTNTVDTLDVALLTALNLAREVIASRESSSEGGEVTPKGDSPRLRALIELVESVEARAENRSAEGPGVPRSGVSETPLLTLPTGDELEAIRGDLLAPLGSSPSAGNVDSGEGGQG
jgi:cell division protein ZapA (FtsZ GTPase activity inhibitor)